MERISLESGGILGFLMWPVVPSLIRLTEAEYISLQIPSFAVNAVVVGPFSSWTRCLVLGGAGV